MKISSFLVFLALASAACGPKAVRGLETPGLDDEAMSTGLDKKDLEKLLHENMKALQAAPVIQRWSQENKPTVAVIPLRNETSEHIDSTLDALIGDIETTLVNAGHVRVISMDQQPKLVEEIRRQYSGAFDQSQIAGYGKQIGAKYVVTGKVYSADERQSGERRVQYFMFIQVLSIETGEILFQHKTSVTKALISIDPLVRGLRVAIAAAALAAVGCASHSDKTKPFRTALDAGQPKQALVEVNEMLDVDSAKELPEEIGGDNALLLLDRGMVLQAIDDYKLSSRDLEVSDKQIEVLDFSRNAAHDIGKYLFSDDVGPYKAPAYEKLMINTMNMVNYLARGDLGGARIEARRLAVMQKFLEQSEGKGRALIGLGSYLAGFTYEKSGKPADALRYYDEALAYGDYPSLHEPIRRLAREAGYRSPRIRRVLGEAEPQSTTTPGAPSTSAPSPTLAPAAAAASAPAPGSGWAAAPGSAPAAGSAPGSPPVADDSAEVLVIVNYGRVPAKIAKRVPIGLALTYATIFMSPANAATANRLAAQGLVTWINYPELGKPHGAYDNPSVSLDADWVQLEGALAVDYEAKRAWEDAKGPIMAAAITRMITRIVAGEALRRSTKDSTLGALLSLGTQATLVAADTPDTRSWATLPARVAVGRVRVPPGKHRIVLTSRGQKRERMVTLGANDWAVASITVLR